MTFKQFNRQFHRWTSIVFTLTVVINFAALAIGKYAVWLGYLPLLPLFLLLFSGLYMFALPYLARGRGQPQGATA